MIKILAMFLCLGFALFWSLFWGIDKKKPFYWKITVVSIVFIAAILTILPPLSGNFGNAIEFSNSPEHCKVDVFCEIIPNTSKYNSETKKWEIQARTATPYTISKKMNLNYIDRRLIIDSDKLPKEFTLGKNLVITVKYNKVDSTFAYIRTISIDPILTYPYIPALLQRIRNLNFHVPMSWTASIAFLMSMIFSIQYLRKRDLDYDIKAASTSLIGLIFTILATSTGMIWAKFNWGTFWNWDPRQISIFILLLIYFAYFALRSSIENRELRARLSSVYGIISFITVPFLIYVAPRLYAGLHPGAQDDGTVGPAVDVNKGMLDSSLAFTYYISLAGFIMVYFWLLNINIRYLRIKERPISN